MLIVTTSDDSSEVTNYDVILLKDTLIVSSLLGALKTFCSLPDCMPDVSKFFLSPIGGIKVVARVLNLYKHF